MAYKYHMHTVKLIYAAKKSQTIKEALTHAAVLNLYVQHSIECYQASASSIVFENRRDLVFASIVLSNSKHYSVVAQ